MSGESREEGGRGEKSGSVKSGGERASCNISSPERGGLGAAAPSTPGTAWRPFLAPLIIAPEEEGVAAAGVPVIKAEIARALP